MATQAVNSTSSPEESRAAHRLSMASSTALHTLRLLRVSFMAPFNGLKDPPSKAHSLKEKALAVKEKAWADAFLMGP